jgi:hypothetical protein
VVSVCGRRVEPRHRAHVSARREVKPGDERLFAFEEKVTLSEARRTGMVKV